MWVIYTVLILSKSKGLMTDLKYCLIKLLISWTWQMVMFFSYLIAVGLESGQILLHGWLPSQNSPWKQLACLSNKYPLHWIVIENQCIFNTCHWKPMHIKHCLTLKTTENWTLTLKMTAFWCVWHWKPLLIKLRPTLKSLCIKHCLTLKNSIIY